jgi:hypothetical protein
MEMNRRYLFGVKVLSITLLTVGFFTAYLTFASQMDYFELVERIQVQNKETPLYVFNEFEQEFDENIHRSNIEYLNENPGLIRRINKDLDNKAVQWKLADLKQRLLFVPEKRKEYAALMETYCKEVVRYILNKTNLKNPYDRIETLLQERPAISGSNITAFLVNNLAKESLCTYTFFNNKSKSLEIQLRGRVFVGEVGSYTTSIQLNDNGTFEFSRNNYTIWQTSAKDPYEVLIVPVEETLHILLRDHTHRAIGEQIKRNSVKEMSEVQKIVEEWVAVEEALAGALANALLPAFAKEYAGNLHPSHLRRSMHSRREFKKYRYLEKGIKIVKRIGFQKAINLYIKDPMVFRSFLI